MGRPSKFNEELATEICHRISCGESLTEICKTEGIPEKSTVLLWVVQDRGGFSDLYAQACQARAHHWAEELVDISDDGRNDYMERIEKETGVVEGYKVNGEAINRSRLRVDTRKWLLSKLLPKYADKQEVDLKSSDRSMSPTTIDASGLSDAALQEIMNARQRANSAK